MKEFLNFLISKFFLKNLLKVVGIFIIIVLIIFTWLRIYTRHSQGISIPDYFGMSLDQVEKITKDKKLRYLVVDSVYVTSAKKGTILDQNPTPGFKVKKNRTIFLTINAVNPEKVMVPNVTGTSLREAKAVLEMRGLIVGRIYYVPDIAMNYVLKQQIKGKEIPEGTLISKGSHIDLVLGRGQSNQTIDVPSLIGMRLYEAEQKLINAYLNPGAIIYDNSVLSSEDSMSARIYKQRPDINAAGIFLGSPVDIWLTIAVSKIPGADTTSVNPSENK
jgi:eukaryotic-like serine/threonine-protein kinase